MVIVVVVLNLGLALACWRVAFALIKIRRAVIAFRQRVLQAEENCRSGLAVSPQFILKAQGGSEWFRQQQGQWHRQSLGLRRSWQLLIWAQRFLQWRSQFPQGLDREFQSEFKMGMSRHE
jgi:hypothetical protein